MTRALGPRVAKAGSPIVAGAVLLLLWQSTVVATGVSPGTLPPPGAVFSRWFALLMEGEYYSSIGATLRIMLAGLGVGVAVGIPLGAAAGMWPLTRAAIWPYVHAVRALPAVALIPVVLTIFPGEQGRVVIIGIACGAIIAVSCGDGFRATAQERLDFAATAELRGLRALFLLYLPEVSRELAVGLRIAASLSLILTVVLEMLLGQVLGLGTYISVHSDNDRPAVFAIVLTLAILGTLINLAMESMARVIVFWVE